MTSSEQRYLPGETVTVTFIDAVVRSYAEARLHVQTAGPGLEFDPTAVDCRVVRTAPADGVPAPGEVWQDAYGGLYFVRGTSRPNDEVQFVGADARTQHPGRLYDSWLTVHRECGPIRRVWAPEPESGGGPDVG